MQPSEYKLFSHFQITALPIAEHLRGQTSKEVNEHSEYGKRENTQWDKRKLSFFLHRENSSNTDTKSIQVTDESTDAEPQIQKADCKVTLEFSLVQTAGTPNACVARK